MTRISLAVPDTLRHRLEIAAKRTRKGLSEYARELLDEALSEKEDVKLDETYQALLDMKGVIKDNDPEVSQNIDRILYGEHGAWRGEPTDNGLWRLPDDK